VRLRLEVLLPQSLGALARGLGAARGALRARFPDAGDRRRALDGALRPGGVLDPLDGGSVERIAGWLAGADSGADGVVEVRLRTFDPEDLTLREARLLGTADRVAVEDGVPNGFLSLARADAVRLTIQPDQSVRPGGGLCVVLRNCN